MDQPNRPRKSNSVGELAFWYSSQSTSKTCNDLNSITHVSCIIRLSIEHQKQCTFEYSQLIALVCDQEDNMKMVPTDLNFGTTMREKISIQSLVMQYYIIIIILDLAALCPKNVLLSYNCKTQNFLWFASLQQHLDDFRPYPFSCVCKGTFFFRGKCVREPFFRGECVREPEV